MSIESRQLLAPALLQRTGARAAFWLVAMLPLPAESLAADADSWVGQKVMPIRAGIRIGHSDNNGNQVYVAELTDLVYAVLNEQDGWLQVQHRGVAGWFDKDNAVLLDDAVSYFGQRIRQNSRDALAYAHRGRAWQEEGELERALRDLGEAIWLDPRRASWFSNRALVYEELGEYERAIRDYNEAIRLNPSDALIYLGRAIVHKARKDYDSAIGDYTAALRADPKLSDAYFNRGNAYKAKKEYDKAIKDYTEAIRLDAQWPDAYFNRANAYKAKRDYDKAVGDYNELLRIDPQDADARSSLAWVLATCPEERIRDGKKAVEHATKACELTSWKASYFLATLGVACAEAGNFQDAAKWQTAALASRQYEKEEGDKARQRLKLFEKHMPYREE